VDRFFFRVDEAPHPWRPLVGPNCV